MAENAVKVSVVRDIPLRRLATIATLEYLDLRAQLCCRENQRLNPDRVDLNDFGVSIFPFGSILESEDRSQEAEKVSSPRDMLKRGIFEASKITYIVLYRVRSCIGPVSPLICVVVRNTEAVRERVSTALAPKKRVWVCPNRVCLVAQKKVRIKLIRLCGALVCLKVD